LPKRKYTNSDLEIYWYPELCTHVSICVRRLPKVFKPKEKPWVDINAAAPEDIIKTIDECPTGALKYSLPDGSKVDSKLAIGPGSINYDLKRNEFKAVKIKAIKNGPLIVEGPVELYCSNGNLLKESSRLVLCRCGHSKNPPYCDGVHKEKGFKFD